MANFPDIFVARKISSSEYDHNMPTVKFFVRFDLDQICLFLDGHSIDHAITDYIFYAAKGLFKTMVSSLPGPTETIWIGTWVRASMRAR
jgi:hypothetical protein